MDKWSRVSSGHRVRVSAELMQEQIQLGVMQMTLLTWLGALLTRHLTVSLKIKLNYR